MIADYLNVTTDYLKDLDIEEKEETTNNITVAEMRIVEIYRKSDLGERECLIKTIEYFSNSCELRKIKGDNDVHLKKYNRDEVETTKTSGETSEEDENPLF